MILYNLKYLNTSYLIIYLKNLSCKAILLLIYLFVLLVYFYILYLIYIKAYEQIIMNTMNTMNLIKIDLNLLYLKELYDSYDTAYGGSGALHLNQCEIIQKLHEINTLNYENIKNINLINSRQNLDLFYSIHNIINYRELLTINPTNAEQIILNNLIKNDISTYGLKLNFQSMMIQEILTTHLENLTKINSQSLRLFILTSPVLIILFSLIYFEKLLILVQA